MGGIGMKFERELIFNVNDGNKVKSMSLGGFSAIYKVIRYVDDYVLQTLLKSRGLSDFVVIYADGFRSGFTHHGAH